MSVGPNMNLAMDGLNMTRCHPNTPSFADEMDKSVPPSVS